MDRHIIRIYLVWTLSVALNLLMICSQKVVKTLQRFYGTRETLSNKFNSQPGFHNRSFPINNKFSSNFRIHTINKYKWALKNKKIRSYLILLTKKNYLNNYWLIHLRNSNFNNNYRSLFNKDIKRVEVKFKLWFLLSRPCHKILTSFRTINQDLFTLRASYSSSLTIRMHKWLIFLWDRMLMHIELSNSNKVMKLKATEDLTLTISLKMT